jgi:hypothetical protein
MGAPACPGWPWGLAFETWDPSNQLPLETPTHFRPMYAGANMVHPSKTFGVWLLGGFERQLAHGLIEVLVQVLLCDFERRFGPL